MVATKYVLTNHILAKSWETTTSNRMEDKEVSCEVEHVKIN